jgi:hypothetical protein
LKGYRGTAQLFEDGIGGFCPDEGLCRPIVFLDEPLDFVVKLGDGGKNTAPQPLSGDDGEEALDGIEP